MHRLIFALAATLAAAPVLAQDPGPLRTRTEEVRLEGRRGPSLLQPGFAVGEYVGFSRGSARSTAIPLRRSQVSNVQMQVEAPSLGGVVQGACEGGQAHTRLLWITFERDDLSYVCRFSGAAPADAQMSLALARGSLMARLQQPQRAGEMTWNGVTYRFETRRVGDLPWGGGRVIGYVISRDGVDVAGVALGGLRPTFYLPPAGSPDRDPAAVLAINLFLFQDPANQM